MMSRVCVRSAMGGGFSVDMFDAVGSICTDGLCNVQAACVVFIVWLISCMVLGRLIGCRCAVDVYLNASHVSGTSSQNIQSFVHCCCCVRK